MLPTTIINEHKIKLQRYVDDLYDNAYLQQQFKCLFDLLYLSKSSFSLSLFINGFIVLPKQHHICDIRL